KTESIASLSTSGQRNTEDLTEKATLSNAGIEKSIEATHGHTQGQICRTPTESHLIKDDSTSTSPGIVATSGDGGSESLDVQDQEPLASSKTPGKIQPDSGVDAHTQSHNTDSGVESTSPAACSVFSQGDIKETSIHAHQNSPEAALDFTTSPAVIAPLCTTSSNNISPRLEARDETPEKALPGCDEQVSGKAVIEKQMTNKNKQDGQAEKATATAGASSSCRNKNALSEKFSSHQDLLSEVSGNSTSNSSKPVLEVKHTMSESSSQGEGLPLDLCVKKSECPTSSSCVSRTRSHLPVQMVLPQVQTQRSAHSPPLAAVMASSPGAVLSPVAHTKPLRSVSGLALGIGCQLYPVGHHQYHGLHPDLVDLKVSSTPEMENFETDTSGDSSHSVGSFSTAPETHSFHGHLHDSAGLALTGSEEPVPAVYVPDAETAVERNGLASHGHGLAKLTTGHTQIRSSALSGKVPAASNLQRSQIIVSESVVPEGFSHTTSNRDSSSLKTSNTNTSKGCHPGSSSAQSQGSNCSEGIMGVTSPYHVSTASALAMSDAELDQEFQQHLLEFKALEKLAERKAREQMQVAIMRKRKAEMLRVMEIKKARREMILKGQKLSLGSENLVASVDNTGASLGDRANGIISMNRQKDVSVYQARHAGGLITTSAAPLGSLSGKHGESTTRLHAPYHLANKGHFPTSRPQATARKEGLPTLIRAHRGVSVSVAAPNLRVVSGKISDDIVPLNLSAEATKSSAMLSSESSRQTGQASYAFRKQSEIVVTSSQNLKLHQNDQSILTTATNTITTVTTATTTSVVFSSTSDNTYTQSTSSQPVASEIKLSTASSVPTQSTSPENICTSITLTSTPDLLTTASSTSASSSVQCNTNVSIVNSCSLDIPESVSTSQAQLVSSDNGATSSVAVTASSKDCASKALSNDLNSEARSEDSVTDATSDLYTLQLKKEILEDDSKYSETAASESSSTPDKAGSSSDSFSQETPECAASVEIKTEILEDDVNVSFCSSINESEKNTLVGGLRVEESENSPEDKTSCANESEEKTDEIKIEEVETVIESETSSCNDASLCKEAPALSETISNAEENSSQSTIEEDDPLNPPGTELSNHAEVSQTQVANNKSCTPGHIPMAPSPSILSPRIKAKDSNPEGVLILKSEQVVETAIDAPLPIDQGFTDRPASPATAHQAPTDTALVDFDSDFTGDVDKTTHYVTGAYHRRDVAVLEPPLPVSRENGGSGSSSCPLPAHNQRPFQAAGSLIVAGNAHNSEGPSAASPSLKRPQSGSGISIAVSSVTKCTVAMPSHQISSTRVPYPEYNTLGKNTTPLSNHSDQEFKGTLPITRRASLDQSKSIPQQRAQAGSGEDQSIDMRYRSVGQPKSSSVPQFNREQNVMCLTSTGMIISPHEHPSPLAITSQFQSQMTSSQTIGQSSRLHSNNPVRPDLTPRPIQDEAKTGLGSKRSAFKSLTRKRSRDASAIDLSLENVNSIKGVFPPGQLYPSDHHIQRPGASSYQDGLAADSLSFQEKLYQQGRQSDPVARGHYPNGHPLLIGSSPGSLSLPPSSTLPSKHAIEMAPSPSKKISTGLDKDRARPGGFLTIRPRPLVRDSAISSTGIHLFTTGTDGMLAGNGTSMPKLQEHVRPSASSVDQHRMRYQRPEGNLAVGNQLSAPAMSSEVPPGSRIMYPQEYARGFPYDGQSEANCSPSSKVSLSRSGDFMYDGAQHGIHNPSNQPRAYPTHLAQTETIPEKRQKPNHPELECRTERFGPTAVDGQVRSSFQRQSELMLSQKHDHQHHQMAPVSTGYLIPAPPPPLQGMFPASYMLSSKQGLSPGLQYSTAPEQGELRRGISTARPSDFPFQAQAAHDNYMKRSYLHYQLQQQQQQQQQQMQNQQQQQLDQEKQRRQHEQQQPHPHHRSVDGNLVRPIPHPKQNYVSPEGAHIGLPALESGSPFAPMQTSHAYMNAYHDSQQKRHQHHQLLHQQQQQQQQQHAMHLQNGPRGPSPHQKNSVTTPPSQGSSNRRTGFMPGMPSMPPNHGVAPPQLLHGDDSRKPGFPRMSPNGNGANPTAVRSTGNMMQGPMGMLQNNQAHGISSTDLHQRQQKYANKPAMYEQRRLSPPPPSIQQAQQHHQQQQQQQQQQKQQQQQQQQLAAMSAQGPATLPSQHYPSQGPPQLPSAVMCSAASGSGGIDQLVSAVRGQVVGKNVCHVCGKMALFLCSSCRQVWYCNPQCQTRHWSIHAPNCKAEAKTQGLGL
ncbi:hypothetical protein EGW08_020225, partial [Elysia chlorotica]